jgi:pilus assembly protein CpaF
VTAVDGDLVRRVHRRLLAAPDVVPDRTDPVAVRACLVELLRDEDPFLARTRLDRLAHELTAEVVGLGALEPLLGDPEVTEVMVNGPGRCYVERHGRLEEVPLAMDAATIVRVAERIVGPLGLRLDRASPMVEARLADGSRLHAVIPPLAIDGPCLTIRRFGTRAVGLGQFGLSEASRRRLVAAVATGANVLVAGATGAGKTTFLNALAAAVPATDRIVTIEETAELRLPHPHVVRLETRPANAEGVGAVGVRQLVRAALRMRPDRIIVGEVRGDEALDLLGALTTGHRGSLSTIHAADAGAALRRLETLALLAGSGLPLVALRREVDEVIDVVVHLRRGPGGRREVDEISWRRDHIDATGPSR